MKIRIFSPFFPHPQNEGAFITIAEQSRRLVELGHQVELIYWKGKTPSQQVVNDHFARILVQRISGQEREPKKFLRILRSLFSTWSSAEIYHYPPSLKKACELILTDEADLELFQYSFSAPWIQSLSKTHAKRVVVFHNQESDLYQRAAQASLGLKKILLHLNAFKLRRNESRLSRWCDEIWFNSDLDLQSYSVKFTPRAVPLRLFPPFFSLRHFTSNRSKTLKKAPLVFGFVGGLHFRPNHLSALWILENLAPELEKKGFEGRLLIIGKNPARSLFSAGKRFPFIEIQGYVEDLGSYWNEVTFSLSPHLEGSGIRMKLIESIVKGIPVVTHPVALSQLSKDLRNHPFVFARETAQEWAEVLLAQTPLKKETESNHSALINPPAWFFQLSEGSAP